MKTTLSQSKIKALQSQFIFGVPQPEDKEAWIEIWSEYASPKEPPSPKILSITWNKLLAPEQNMRGIFIHHKATQKLVGFIHYILHDSTWSEQQRCYIEDAHILHSHRGRAALTLLYKELIHRAKSEKWEKIYWMTRPDNIAAQRAYNRVADKTNWIRYEQKITK